jgi:hypothetical protein
LKSLGWEAKVGIPEKALSSLIPDATIARASSRRAPNPRDERPAFH